MKRSKQTVKTEKEVETGAGLWSAYFLILVSKDGYLDLCGVPLCKGSNAPFQADPKDDRNLGI